MNQRQSPRRSRAAAIKGGRFHLIPGSSPLPLLLLLLLSSLLNSCLLPVAHAAAKEQQQQQQQSLQDLEYAVYPIRSQEEAAVIEWGHSAIISALDAAVAEFGPQTVDAALLEVETQPVLADPVNGVFAAADTTNDNEATAAKPTKLNNADAVHGNVVVMTNTGLSSSSGADGGGGLTGVDLAMLAQNSGAAALVVVNVDDERPDDIYRLTVGDQVEEAAAIDIPVVVISLSSANVLTSATVTEHTPQHEIVNNGMPDRCVAMSCLCLVPPSSMNVLSLTHLILVPFSITCWYKQRNSVFDCTPVAIAPFSKMLKPPTPPFTSFTIC